MASQPVHINIAAYHRLITRVVQPYLMKKGHEIAKAAGQNAPVGATGDLAQSIVVQAGEKGGATVKVNAPHAGFVHQGTGPQHVPDPRSPYFPRLRSRGLILWSMTKGLDPFKVAQGISQSGTPPTPFLANAIETVLGRFRFRWIKKDLTL